jgi:tagaturonate reductase
MNHLFRQNLRKLRKESSVAVADDSVFYLPERVLQFGTGAFLRGLPDYFIDKANRQGIFNGRIVVVKTTEKGDLKAFERQDNLYTICARGVSEGELIEENVISSSISRVLSAKTQWSLVLDLAKNPAVTIVISNTTELGIQLVQDDIYQWPPISFPGKLLAFLYARFVAFGGSADAGMVIVTTELITNNAKKLEAIILELAHRNGLEGSFIDWLEQSNDFCNSLVDRIVPGKPDDDVKKQLEEQLGYEDDLMIMTEHYRLWAIEGDQKIRDVLSFCQADSAVVIETNIDLYRELKLRLLNGAHTLGAGLAHLCGFTTVREAMSDPAFSHYLSVLMATEIAPTISQAIDDESLQRFTRMVLDRFRNPFIEHKWLNITPNYSAKMQSRVMPSFFDYYQIFQTIPDFITFGFAVYMYYMKSVRKDGNQYYGLSNGSYYLIQDPRAAYFYQKWQNSSLSQMVRIAIKDQSIWGKDLSKLGVIEDNIVNYLESLQTQGALASLVAFLEKAEFARA